MRGTSMRNRERRARSARSTAPRGRDVGRRNTRDGFTIIELIVAIVILVVGVLGLAGTAGMVSRMVGGAAQQTIAANVAASRFETLRSVPCAQLVGGTATTRGINEKWTVKTDPGNAALWSVKDEITYVAAGGRSRTLTFESYVRCP